MNETELLAQIEALKKEATRLMMYKTLTALDGAAEYCATDAAFKRRQAEMIAESGIAVDRNAILPNPSPYAAGSVDQYDRRRTLWSYVPMTMRTTLAGLKCLGILFVWSLPYRVGEWLMEREIRKNAH
jgi:hypothetical protein